MGIIWSDFAKENLRDFTQHSKMKSPTEYVEELVKSVSILAEFPEAGKTLFYANKIEVRQLLYEKHRILYCIKKNQVQIGAVLHTAKDLGSSLRFANRFFN